MWVHPIKRHEENEDENRVCREHICPHYRRKRRVKAAQQPDALVIKGEVVSVLLKSSQAVNRGRAETHDI